PDPFRLIIDVRGTPRAAEVPAPGPERVTPSLGAAAPRAAPKHRIKIVLDPGHGGRDPGAIGIGGVAEKDVVLAIALRLRERLAALPDTDVVLTRDHDIFLALEERTARANAEQADLFVSIHGNASSNEALSGVETYYLNNTHDRA